MNELIHHAVLWLTEGEMSPFDVEFRLNDVVISSLPGLGGGGNGKPREAFKKLLLETSA